MNKELIHSRFSKTLATYNENAKIQKRMAEKLVELAKRKAYENILEIGCGTGLLTELTVKKFEYKNYTAIDLVEECAEYINRISPDITFINCDIENFLPQTNEKYDLIISNAALQWVNDFEGVINSLKKRLNKNGELIFSTFGKENFREISFITNTQLEYYSIKDLEEMFPNSYIYPEIYVMAFDSPKDVLNHLKLTGVNAIENKSWTKKDLINFENGYRNLCPTRPTLTYNPIYFQYIFCPIG